MQSETIKLNTGGRGKLEVDLRYAWDDEYLYVLARETQKGAQSKEAKDAAAFASEPWNHDGVWMYIVPFMTSGEPS